MIVFSLDVISMSRSPSHAVDQGACIARTVTFQVSS